ncbi:MAG: DUF3786 domain-containing protein [Chloroflexi bacterium]|nr:DUF3786 domain-containing protein [Chloroflexota bacterium]
MPDPVNRLAKESVPGFSRRVGELRSELRLIPAKLLSEQTGCEYSAFDSGKSEFRLELYNSPVICKYPDLFFYNASGDELPEFQQLLLLYYFATSDGAPLTGKFVSFADLPVGRIYSQAFQGYSGDEVVKVFGENVADFKTACIQENGLFTSLGDAAYIFQVLPRVSAQFVYWLGDEDFPSSCKILFDAAATHYIPIDACAIVGSYLARRIIKAFLANK